ncbi:MAG: extracellular solute-binding protein [Lachnospiraceae bacterium]|nr:extracellular solute-binding protein [Lachnospiraceae bacterium]
MRHGKAKNRIMLVLLIMLVLGAVICMIEFLNSRQQGKSLIGSTKKETVRLWYTDDALTDYLNNKALAFYDKTDIRVETRLVSGVEYLEAINNASLGKTQDEVSGEKLPAPDVYIVTNDSLEKAYLAGLALDITDRDIIIDDGRFPQSALNSICYDGKFIGCPMYFETSALVYNKTYLEEIAASANESNGNTDSEASDMEMQVAEISADDLIPDSIADILNFADLYSVPENVENFFRWDVSDIFYNYFFIGNYITVGGRAGDNENDINIYNTESVSTLKVYQELKQFFSIETKESDYNAIIQEFIDGKTIYTIATSDCIRKVDQAAADGEFKYEYGVAKLPNINSDLVTKGMSITDTLVINGYSDHKDSASEFVKYLVNEQSSDLFDMTGKISAVKQENYSDKHVEGFVMNYEDSVPIPKMVDTSNFWVELEICFAKIWNGTDANTQLRMLSEKIKTQLAGSPVEEVPIEDPKVELLPAVEYEEIVEG